jgi:hypothetical protein
MQDSDVIASPLGLHRLVGREEAQGSITSSSIRLSDSRLKIIHSGLHFILNWVTLALGTKCTEDVYLVPFMRVGNTCWEKYVQQHGNEQPFTLA